MSKTAAVILAGGQGKRLGGAIKANIKLDGVRLIERVEAIATRQARSVIVSCGSFEVGRIKTRKALEQVADDKGPSAGPVSGLAASADWCLSYLPDYTYLLSIAVDTPFFPDDFEARARDMMTEDVDVVIGAMGEQRYPTNALWRLSALYGLSTKITAGLPPVGLKAVIKENRTRILDYPEPAPLGVFFNINSMADLLAASREPAPSP